MKLFAILISCLVTFGCAHSQMRFNIAPGSTQDDFTKARMECGDDSGGGGGFIFGPLIIVAPVIAVIESVKFAKRHGLQDCLEAKGFKCIENCAHVSQYLERGQPKTSPPAMFERKEVATVTEPPALMAKEIKKDGHFIAYDNGTVLDTRTNLMWAAKDNGSDVNWEDAKNHCENYRGGGYSDWRMPTQEELAGLYDRSKSYKATQQYYNVKLTEFIQLSACCPWASETRGSDAAHFYFINGNWIWTQQSGDNGFRALPVRSAK